MFMLKATGAVLVLVCGIGQALVQTKGPRKRSDPLNVLGSDNIPSVSEELPAAVEKDDTTKGFHSYRDLKRKSKQLSATMEKMTRMAESQKRQLAGQLQTETLKLQALTADLQKRMLINDRLNKELPMLDAKVRNSEKYAADIQTDIKTLQSTFDALKTNLSEAIEFIGISVTESEKTSKDDLKALSVLKELAKTDELELKQNDHSRRLGEIEAMSAPFLDVDDAEGHPNEETYEEELDAVALLQQPKDSHATAQGKHEQQPKKNQPKDASKAGTSDNADANLQDEFIVSTKASIFKIRANIKGLNGRRQKATETTKMLEATMKERVELDARLQAAVEVLLRKRNELQKRYSALKSFLVKMGTAKGPDVLAKMPSFASPAPATDKPDKAAPNKTSVEFIQRTGLTSNQAMRHTQHRKQHRSKKHRKHN